MRVVIQRVKKGSVTIDNALFSQIGKGLVVLVGICDDDNDSDIEWLVKKTVNLRIFDDSEGVMNRSLIDTDGELLVVSQFTLMASTVKGNRPSYIKASKGEVAVPIYDKFVEQLQKAMNKRVATGVFGADMVVEIINDGPVTITIDSKARE